MNLKKFDHIGPETDIGKHYEYYPAFQRMSFTVVNNLSNCFQDICNPLKENKLIVLGTGEVMIPKIH